MSQEQTTTNASAATTAQLAITIIDAPSHSKGWGRYSVTDPSTDKPLLTSRTGNRWMSAKNGAELPVGTPILLTVQVMLRVGKNKREEITKSEVPMIVMANETMDVQHQPGSQGMTLHIVGACEAKPQLV